MRILLVILLLAGCSISPMVVQTIDTPCKEGDRLCAYQRKEAIQTWLECVNNSWPFKCEVQK